MPTDAQIDGIGEVAGEVAGEGSQGTQAEAGNGDESSAETQKAENKTVPYERFADVNRRLRKMEAAAAKAEQDAAAAEQAKMEEDGRLKELVDLRNAELEETKASVAEMQAKFRAATLKQSVSASATKAGFTNPEDASAFLDLAGFEFDDSFAPIGVDDAVQALAVERPYLLTKTAAPGNGTGPTPAGRSDKAEEEIRRSARSYVRQRF